MGVMHLWVWLLAIPLYLLYKQQMDALKGEALVDDTKMGIRQLQLLFMALLLMLIALSRPVVSSTRTSEKFDSQEFIVALDASFSMQADDLKPTRYTVAKEAIKKLLTERPTDRFSLFAFTSNALLISPPTTDTAISLMALDALEPKYILTKSTNLKALLETIAASTFKEKKLVIFSDGGEEQNLNTLSKICTNNGIVLYIVATGSKRGASLRKDGKLVKDQYSSLVISRINPILKELALKSGGHYYPLDTNDLSVIDTLVSDLDSQDKEEANVSVQSYLDLYYGPLGIAIILFILAVTNLHQRTLLLLLLMIMSPHSARAGSFDFYYLHKANKQFKMKEYDRASQSFMNVSPSTISYYNIGVSNYKAKKYKDAMRYFGAIETKDSVLKQRLLYNMGNCAVRLKYYDRAMSYYRQALSLGEDTDARYNLRLLQRLHLDSKVNIADMLPEKDAKTKKSSSKKTSTTQDEKKEGEHSSNSKRQSNESSAGAGSDKKGKTKKAQNLNQSETSKSEYKVGYKLYELINKGYTDEKEPW